MNTQPKHYEVIDVRTGLVVKTCKTRNGATRSADNRDRSYGAVVCVVRPVYSN